MEQRRRVPRKPADQRQRPAQFPHAIIQIDRKSNTVRLAHSGVSLLDLLPVTSPPRTHWKCRREPQISRVASLGPARRDCDAYKNEIKLAETEDGLRNSSSGISVREGIDAPNNPLHRTFLASSFTHPQQGEAGSIRGRIAPGFPNVGIVHTMLLVGGFSRGSPVSPTLAFRCFTLIGSQDLDVKSCPNLFTHTLHSVGGEREGGRERERERENGAMDETCLIHQAEKGNRKRELHP
ncbi:hypothetical protein PR048_000817 [Dryococelus australis]|uniref:Uncharacterized protein n=1 Tax=Dryococelus australis TaxID=614101 RepID=A0ABQ9IFR0_9NEOP|nr:hypothetical protein PR048_000817 [Dryococelus australis]